jgi:hypothetical protein
MQSDFLSTSGSRAGLTDTDYNFKHDLGPGYAAPGSFGGEDTDQFARALSQPRNRVNCVQNLTAGCGGTSPRQTYRTRRRNPSSTSTTARPDDTSPDEKVYGRARLGATAAAGHDRGRIPASSAAAGTKLNDFPALDQLDKNRLSELPANVAVNVAPRPPVPQARGVEAAAHGRCWFTSDNG